MRPCTSDAMTVAYASRTDEACGASLCSIKYLPMNTAVTDAAPVSVTGENVGSRSLARLVLVEAAVLGVLADATMRTESAGAGFTLWTLGLAVTVALVALRSGRPLKPLQYVWLGLSLLFAVAFAWRDADMLQVMNFMAAHAALVLFTMSAVSDGGRVFGARLRDIFRVAQRTVLDAAFGAPVVLGRDAQLGEATRQFMSERIVFLRAVLIALPLLFVFGKLLSSADPVFAELVGLPDIDFESIIPHLFVGGLAAWVSAGWMRSVFLKDRMRASDGEPARPLARTTDITVVLGSLNALFLVFVGLQARWLFGGAEVIRGTTGLTVAEYARKGFFELVAVATLVLPLLLGSRALAEGDAAAVRRHRLMALPMLGLMGGIMLSAVQRMNLYVGNFGLTTDRVYALAFMAWLTTVFVCMGVTVLRGWVRPFATWTVLSAFGGLVAMNAANPEAAVARYEIGRTNRATPIDWKYLSSLSGDAVPVVVPALLAAEPGQASCDAARQIIRRSVNRGRGQAIEFNAGEYAGKSVVLERFTPHSLRRLCAGYSAISPSASLSR